MPFSPKFLMAMGAGAIVAAWVGASAGTAIAKETAAQQVPAKPAAFATCAACHSVEPGKNGVGPSLAGIAGRKAGNLPGFAYSNALKNSGIIWGATSLDRWLTSPQQAFPGTKMPFAGIPDPARRREVVNYLLALK